MGEYELATFKTRWCGSGVFEAWMVGVSQALCSASADAMPQMATISSRGEGPVPGYRGAGEGWLSQDQGGLVSCVAGLHLVGTNVV